ncbi:hypothetical protein [Roseateles sp.]|uniref:hypothetical protein n=1 Tax=Roseateles sp. TaxID=1971397 RepID=UPI003BA8F469
MQTADRSDRHPIGPFVRVLASLLLAPMAVLSAPHTVVLWQATALTPPVCSGRRYPVFCELTRLALSATPGQLHGPLAAALNVAFVALLAWLVWWLLRPLLLKRHGG